MKRDTFWDSLKFLLIFFVVYGHMIETYAPDGSYHRSMYNFIYAFHMPFFMFISGRFSQIKNRKKYRHSNVKLFETYLIFQTIRCLKDIYLNGDIDIVEGILYPKGTLWYISLFDFVPHNCLHFASRFLEKTYLYYLINKYWSGYSLGVHSICNRAKVFGVFIIFLYGVSIFPREF